MTDIGIGAATELPANVPTEREKGEAAGRFDRSLGYRMSDSSLGALYGREYAVGYAVGWAQEPADADATGAQA